MRYVRDSNQAKKPRTPYHFFRHCCRPPGSTMHRYTFTDGDLAKLKATCDEYDDAYVMFNNLTMHEDARRFRALLDA